MANQEGAPERQIRTVTGGGQEVYIWEGDLHVDGLQTDSFKIFHIYMWSTPFNTYLPITSQLSVYSPPSMVLCALPLQLI